MEPGPPAQRLRDATGGGLDDEVGLRAVRGERLRQPGDHSYEEVRHRRALVLRGTEIEMGRTPKEVVWEKGKARLYRYDTGVEKRFAVPVLLVYALILRPYILNLVPNRIAHLQNVLNLCTNRLDRYRRQNRTAGGERSRDRSALGV
jgi:hypothetical protein